MSVTPTLSRYFGRQYLAWVLLVFGVVVGLVIVIDLIELVRRTANNDCVNFLLLLEMAVLKSPFQAQRIAPFATLIGGMLVFSRLTRNNEFIVARAAGVSAWRFLLPALAVAFGIGAFLIMVFNPLAAAMVARYDALEAQYISGKSSTLSISESGVWLRDATEDGLMVIHATRVSEQGSRLRQVIIFRYDEDDRFTTRIDAESARLGAGVWHLQNAYVTGIDQPAQHEESLDVPTTLTPAQILDNFAAPETMSFWALPSFITTLKKAGFAARNHRLYWHSIMALPLLLSAMVLLAATFSLRLTRRGGTGALMVAGIFVGFMLYFITGVVYALGQSGNIPVILAAWTPAGVATLFGSSFLLHLEDG